MFTMVCVKTNIQLQSLVHNVSVVLSVPIGLMGDLTCIELDVDKTLILKVCEDWEGSGWGIPRGPVGSESILVRVQADREVVFDLLRNQFFKALHKDRNKCHTADVSLCEKFFYLLNTDSKHFSVKISKSCNGKCKENMECYIVMLI